MQLNLVTEVPAAVPSPPAQDFTLSSVLDRRLDPGRDAPLAVAYSGGGDSLYLLLGAVAWARRAGRQVLALHVDHALQPASGAWAAQAQATACELGAQFRKLEWTGDKPHTGLAAAARSARLRLLADAVREAGACVLLLGHTADDVLEADIMRAEGSGLGRVKEWSPSPVWPEGRGVFHCRPLLGLRRADLRRHLALAGRSWIDDPANEDLRFARARARALTGSSSHPSVQTPIPGFAGTSPTGEDLRRDPPPWGRGTTRSVVEGVSAGGGALHAFARTIPNTQSNDAGSIRLAQAALVGLDAASLRRLVSAVLTCVSGREQPARGRRVAALARRVVQEEPIVATLGGCRVERLSDAVLVAREAGQLRRDGCPDLPLTPGLPVVWDGRFEVEALTPGWKLQPLQGIAARLPKAERRLLRLLPTPVRGALPAAVNGPETVTCPILASGDVRARSLVRGRLLAACGAVSCEAQAVGGTDGEDDFNALSSGSKFMKADR